MIIWSLLATLMAGFTGLGVYIYFMRQGQFDDPEDVKYQIFRNEEEER